MFGSYNKPFGAVTSPNAWICSDEAVVAAYDADPLCGFDATVGLARDLLTGVETSATRPRSIRTFSTGWSAERSATHKRLQFVIKSDILHLI